MIPISKSFTNPLSGHKVYADFSLPDVCPVCHQGTQPYVLSFNVYSHKKKAYAVFNLLCTRCPQPFIVWFLLDDYGHPIELLGFFPAKVQTKKFDNEINEISERFVNVYNEAFAAEQSSLFEICGAGYRKALEILIKDYLISKNPEEEQSIKNTLLGNCIKQKITDPNIKMMAERCTWLGNDFTHYERIYTDMDIADMKTLLELTLHWISAEILTEKFMSMDHRK